MEMYVTHVRKRTMCGVDVEPERAKLNASASARSLCRVRHCTGDGIKMGEKVGAQTIDLEWVQVRHWCSSPLWPDAACGRTAGVWMLNRTRMGESF